MKAAGRHVRGGLAVCAIPEILVLASIPKSDGALHRETRDAKLDLTPEQVQELNILIDSCSHAGTIQQPTAMSAISLPDSR